MFGINKLKSELNQKFAALEQKGQSVVAHWTPDGKRVPLFDFDKGLDINKAIKNVPELASILNYIGKSFSSGIYFEQSGDNLKDETPIIELLNNPNEFYSGAEFKQNFSEQLFAYGVCHLYMNTPSIPLNTKQIHILPTHLTNPYIGDAKYKDIIEAPDSIIQYYEVDLKNGNVLKIPPEKVITITLNTNVCFENEFVKYQSPLKPLQDALMVTPAMYDTMHNLMDNFGMRGFVSNKTSDSGTYVPIKPQEKEEINKQFKKYGLKKGQRQMAWTAFDLQYVPISSPIKDILLPEQQKMIKTIIADILGFDTAILNNDAANKYANYKEARKSLFTENIIPASKNYTETLSKYFEKDIILDFEHLDVFSADEKTKSEKIAIESQYIINLNTAVATGMSRDAAIELLILNGYNDETAKKLIS